MGAAAGRTQTPTQTPTQSRLDRGQELGQGSEVTSTLAGLWELGCLRSLTFNNFHATQCSWSPGPDASCLDRSVTVSVTVSEPAYLRRGPSDQPSRTFASPFPSPPPPAPPGAQVDGMSAETLRGCCSPSL